MSFNPTMVRLLRCESLTTAEGNLRFNPTMVRLLQRLFARHFQIQLGFNPTMVRLLRLLVFVCMACFWSFQSHNGAIAAV